MNWVAGDNYLSIKEYYDNFINEFCGVLYGKTEFFKFYKGKGRFCPDGYDDILEWTLSYEDKAKIIYSYQVDTKSMCWSIIRPEPDMKTYGHATLSEAIKKYMELYTKRKIQEAGFVCGQFENR